MGKETEKIVVQNRIVMSLDPEIAESLKTFAEEDYMKISALVRNAANAYLKRKNKKGK